MMAQILCHIIVAQTQLAWVSWLITAVMVTLPVRYPPWVNLHRHLIGQLGEES
jgi:hypothetical protein